MPLLAVATAGRRPDLTPFAMAAAVGGTVLILRPQWAVPAFVAVTWTAIGAAFFGGVSPVEIGGLAVLALAAWNAPSRPDITREAVLVVALIGLPVLITWLLAAPESPIPFDHLRDLTFILIVALTVSGVGGIERSVRLLGLLGILLGLGAVYSVLVHATPLFPLATDPSGNEAPRAAGPNEDPNFFGLSMAALVPLALYLPWRKGAWRLLGYGSALCLLAGILATGSRGGLAAAVVGAVAFGLWSGQRRMLAISSVAVVAALLILLPVFASQVESSRKRTVSGRATENQIALAMFADHPLTGVGPGQYVLQYRDYARRVGNDPRPQRFSHSLPLEVMAEQGLIGVAGWLATALVIARAARRYLLRNLLGIAVISSVLGYTTGSFFLHGSQLRIPYLLIGLVLAFVGAATKVEGARR